MRHMMARTQNNVRIVLAVIAVFMFLVSSASADELDVFKTKFMQLAGALGLMMIVFHAVRYLSAESPDTRADSKKALTYVIIGLLLAALTIVLVTELYCANLAKSLPGETVTCP